jgi:cobalt/nickel transport system permease protein
MGGAHAGRARAEPRRGVGAAVAPEAKVVAVLVFVGAVVATPREAVWAFVAHAGFVAAAAMSVDLPLRTLARRLVFELPFVAFAFFLPFIGRGERIEVLGVSLSRAGLWGGWNIVAKGTLGVAATAVLAATTTSPQLLRGLGRLRVPAVLTAIAGFMIRYAEVLRGEAERMRIARISRGDDPRALWQAKALATGSGSLFVRAYERGERVHLAMQSRGFTGEMPALDSRRAVADDWKRVAAFPVAAVGVALAAWVLR